jgi:hypothetical protein
MALIRGTGSACPCPICLIRNKNLSDLSKIAERRTTQTMKEIYDRAQNLGGEDKEELLQKHGLRDVEVCNNFLCLHY